MRAIRIPAYDSYLGHHYITMGVLPDSLKETTEYYLSDFYPDDAGGMEALKSDLAFTPCNYYQVFDLLRSNRTPAYYDSASLLHRFDSSILELAITPDETLNSTFSVFNNTISVPSTVVSQFNRCTISIHNGYGLATNIVLNGTSIEFLISCPCIFESQLNGDTFNFTNDDNRAGKIDISVRETTQGGVHGLYVIASAGYAGGSVNASFISAVNGKDGEDGGTPDNDPYSGGDGAGGSGTGGGGYDPNGSNNYTPDSESNPVPSLPSLSAVDTGLITLFAPSLSQIRALANYLWGVNFDLDQFKKLFADPMGALLGLSIVPVTVSISGSSSVKFGNIDTGVSMGKASSQYIELDCGTVSLKEYWKGFMDYSPHTRVSIFLPYIGCKELDIDLFQNTNIGVVYHVDILTGGCVAFVTAGGNVIAQFSGECAVNIPITSQNFTQTIMAMGQIVAGGVGLALSGGMSAPISASMIGNGVTAMSNTAGNIVSSKPVIGKSGVIGGSSGLLGSQKPFLIIEKPKQCAPKRQNQYAGYPSYITKTLGSVTGFTQVQEIKLNGISCTETERNELLSILRAGVIV